MKFACLRAFYGHRHLVSLVFLYRDVFHCQELYIPRVFTFLGCVNLQSISTIKSQGVAIFGFI